MEGDFLEDIITYQEGGDEASDEIGGDVFDRKITIHCLFIERKLLFSWKRNIWKKKRNAEEKKAMARAWKKTREARARRPTPSPARPIYSFG